MRYYPALWAALVIVGLYGALRFSAIFFGLFTMGLFLIVYDFRTKEQITPTFESTASQTCPNCGISLEASGTFCPNCGEKVRNG